MHWSFYSPSCKSGFSGEGRFRYGVIRKNILVKIFQWLFFFSSLHVLSFGCTYSIGHHILCYGAWHVKSGCEAKDKQGQRQHCCESSRDLSSTDGCSWDTYIRSHTGEKMSKQRHSQLEMAPTSCSTCEKSFQMHLQACVCSAIAISTRFFILCSTQHVCKTIVTVLTLGSGIKIHVLASLQQALGPYTAC